MKKISPIFLLLILGACTLPEEKEVDLLADQTDTTSITTASSHTASSKEIPAKPIPAPKKIKNPSGIFRAIIPFTEGVSIEQTIAFEPDNTFLLQEKYIGKKDSLVITEGNWSPSDGHIWLYTKDQVVRGRYAWKGNVLQWVSPELKKNFSMELQKDALENSVWLKKKNEGLVLFGIGNEPFWNVSVSNKDSITFLQSEWTHPLTLKIDSSKLTTSEKTFIAQEDSLQLRLTVYHQFCSDGMSDYVYRNRIRLQYNTQVFNGCGILYK